MTDLHVVGCQTLVAGADGVDGRHLKGVHGEGRDDITLYCTVLYCTVVTLKEYTVKGERSVTL